MTNQRFNRVAEGLMKAASMSADELAAKQGEGDLFVKIKRNSERLDACLRHDFEPNPKWRDVPMFKQVAHCRSCGGDMKMHDAMVYLRGFAHGSGQDLNALANAIWPPLAG